MLVTSKNNRLGYLFVTVMMFAMALILSCGLTMAWVQGAPQTEKEILASVVLHVSTVICWIGGVVALRGVH